MFYLGIFILLAAFMALLWNLYTSYETQCGGLGQVPVFGATIIQIPLLAILGLKLLDDAGSLHLQWWHYPAIWLVLVVVLGGLVTWVGRLKSQNKGPL
jgi:hypothetical protein